MNLVYFKFLFIQTIKRRPVWVTWILFLFAISCFLIILPAASGIETLQIWANTTVSFAQTIMAMIAGVFTAVLAINIFRDTQEEGTELIVISKPITRNKIVLTKFLVFGCVCLMVNITAVLLTCFTILLPQTEKAYFTGLVVSMFIGNAIVFAISGAISILTSVKWAKIGVIVTNLLVTLILLIFQIISAFVFDTPIKALQNHEGSMQCYIYPKRDMETGEYTEKNLVTFGINASQIKHPEETAITWKNVLDFWNNDIKGVDPSNILNAADIASQLALTYSSYDLHNFSRRQAKRLFGLSRYYNYNLVKPASPENIEKPYDIPWLWTWSDRKWPNPLVPGQNYCIVPASIIMPVIEAFNINSLKGLTNKLPIGRLRSSDELFWTNVYFEPNEWKQYKPGFDQIIKFVFDYQIKQALDGSKDYYDYRPGGMWINDSIVLPTQWTQNLGKAYDLLWYFLTENNPQNIIDMKGEQPIGHFNVHTVKDVNTRFLQFSYYLMFKLYEEQQKYLTQMPNDSELQQQIKWQYASLTDDSEGLSYEQVLRVKLCDPDQTPFGGFYMECAKDPETNEYYQDGILPPGVKIPCYDWIYNTVLPNPTDDQIVATPRNRLAWISSISDHILMGNKDYLYDSLETPSRSGKFKTRLNYCSDNWYENSNWWVYQLVPDWNPRVPSSANWFEYEITPRTHNWIFAVVWGVIALAGYAGGSIIYKKYDVK